MLPSLFTHRRNRFILLCGIVGSLTLVLLVVPGLLGSAPFCSLPKVHAQDNPCVAQQATISALQGLLLQSTLDHTNNQGTLTVLQNQLHANPVPTLKPAVGLPFDDKFADNHNGWDITTHPVGKATIADNRLTMATHSNATLYLPIPGLNIGSHFYAEVTVIDTCGCPGGQSPYYGFVVGDIDKNNVVSFAVQEEQKDTQHVVFYDSNPAVNNYLVDSRHKGMIESGKPVVVGLEANGNVFTFYVNGKEADAFRINPTGQQLGIYFYHAGGDEMAIAFTEVLVRESR